MTTSLNNAPEPGRNDEINGDENSSLSVSSAGRGNYFLSLPARVRDWMFKFSKRPAAMWWLFGFSFAESSFFLIPPDVLLVPIGAARPKKALRAGALCTFGSVSGAALGYLIGLAINRFGLQAFLYNTWPGGEMMSRVTAWYETYGSFVLFLAGVSPIPFKVFTITSGFFYNQIGFLPFIMICTISRGMRFMAEAVLLRIFGVRIQHELEKRMNFWSLVFTVLLIAGFIFIKWRPWER